IFVPQGAIFGGDADPFAELIRKAHARGVEVHGWYNVSLRQAPIYPEFAPEGAPKDAFDLQDPAFRDFIVNEIVEFATRYEVDGINLDYIRTDGVSFSPTARELYRKKYGKDIDELKDQNSPEVRQRFLEWQEAAVSDIVRRVSEGVKAVRPKAVISISGHPKPKPALDVQGRNEWLWVERGWVDVVYDMDYGRVPNINVLERVRLVSSHPERFAKVLGNYERREGRAVPREPELVARQMEYFLRKFPGRGIGLYIYSMLSEEQIQALQAGPFKEAAVASWE
ncbi:MAG: family 10 glycosylhydrolase, partial [Armatimonadetes bacterium]|nr:family 10 glycosylhydrolase [Armatimonadota bacterium]